MSAFGSQPFVPGNAQVAQGEPFTFTKDQYGNIKNIAQITDFKNIQIVTTDLLNNGINSGNLTPSAVTSTGLISSGMPVTDVTSTTGTTLPSFVGIITRTGPTAAYSDTTPTAASIVENIPNAVANASYFVLVQNTVAFALTLVAGSGVTLAGNTGIAASSSRLYQVTVTNATLGSQTVMVTGLMEGSL